MDTLIKSLEQILVPGESVPKTPWQLRVVQSDQCLSYVAWNESTREALLVDPKREDKTAYHAIASDLTGYRWLAVIDTHTHADHVSAASDMADELIAPLVMHVTSPSRRVHMRTSRDTFLPSQAAPVQILQTPGHTPDSLTVLWGPFLFGGDTLLFGDTGRDDLPGGDPEAHFDSLVKIKSLATPEMILLPGHDHKDGRASSWGTQLKINSSLTQGREDFIREASAFDAPAPTLLKESLRKNFR